MPRSSATGSSSSASRGVPPTGSSCACIRRWCRRRRLIANVEGAMNAVLVKGDAVGATLYYGPGAGAEPTASAVIADLVDVTRMHTADPEHRVPHLAFQPDQLSSLPFLPMGEVETSYYLRMRVDDQPGVLADIARILADRGISIDAMIQKEPPEGEKQTDIILLTHVSIETQRRRRDRRDRGVADGARKDRPHPARRAAGMTALMNYVSTRGRMTTADAALPFRAILLEGLAADGGLAVPERYPRFCCRRDRSAARISTIADSRSPCCRSSSTTSRRPTLRRLDRRDLRRRDVRRQRDHAAAHARARPSPVARRERPDARVQGHRAATAWPPVRVRARGRAPHAEHPRRDVRRYRLVRRACDARQARRRGVHAVAERADEPVPAGADVLDRRSLRSTTSRSRARSTIARTSSRRSLPMRRSSATTASAR